MSAIGRIKQWLRDLYKSDERSDLSPACRELLDLYHLSGEEHEGEVFAVGIYPETQRVIVIFYASVLRAHPAFSSNGYAAHHVKVTFSGVTNAQAFVSKEPLPRGEMCDMSLGSLDEFEIKGNVSYNLTTPDRHIQTLYLQCWNLVLEFTFKNDLKFEEVVYFRPGSEC